MYHGGAGEGGWNVESPHILAGKNRQCGGGEETRIRGLREGRDGEERVK